MSQDKERGAAIIGAHQELVAHIEQSAGRIRILSMVTVAVAAVLAASYASQLVLPLTGPAVQTVDLADPAVVASELVVLALVLVWLYVGVRDLRFSWRMRDEIRAARAKEREIEGRLA